MNIIQNMGTGVGLFAVGKVSAYIADRYLIRHTVLGRFVVVQIENFPVCDFLFSNPEASLFGRILRMGLAATMAMVLDVAKMKVAFEWGDRLPREYVWLIGSADATPEHIEYLRRWEIITNIILPALAENARAQQ